MSTLMKSTRPRERKGLPLKKVIIVLTEAGYRCAVPTCRGILALDMHHIWEVRAGGGDDSTNLIALCPTCHALYHRGTISQHSIYAYKAILLSLSQAFDVNSLDDLLFLEQLKPNELYISGDGVLKFSRLIASGLAHFDADVHTIISGGALQHRSSQLVYEVQLTEKGRMLLAAWKSGDRGRVEAFFAGHPPKPERA